MRANGWTKEEEGYIVENHKTMTDKQIAATMPGRGEGKPGRTVSAVSSRRRELGFGKYKRPRRLKTVEILPDRAKSRFAREGRPLWDGFVQTNRGRIE